MNNIIVYSTGCPRCKILEKALAASNLPYTVIDDVDIIIKEGFDTVPQMRIAEDQTLDFKAAMNWIKEKTNG